MSYEITMYIGCTPTVFTGTKQPNYFRVYAMLELGDPLHNSEVFKLSTKTEGIPIYFYERVEGNTRVFSDYYKKPLFALSVGEVREAIRKDLIVKLQTRDDWNRRELYIAAVLLQQMNNEYYPEGLNVVLFGH